MTDEGYVLTTLIALFAIMGVLSLPPVFLSVTATMSGEERRKTALQTALAVGIVMGPSRLVLGVHWPTDILGGWLLGGAVVCGVAALVLARSGSAGDARRT